MSVPEKPHWTDLKPWHLNAALIVFGCGLVGYTRQLIFEDARYIIGNAAVACCSMLLFLGAVAVFLIKPRNVDRWTFPIILTFAIACRVVTLFPDPFLSSDVYRYVWDGVVQHAHINPYRYVPGDPALTFLRAPNLDVFNSMNRRDYAHTIYPPAAQMIFYAITFFSPAMTAMKLGMVLFEGLTMYGLVLLLREMGKPREWTILYAWFPMLIWEIAGSGHIDAVVIAFVTFALLFRYRRQNFLTGLFLGLAVLTKFFPLVLFPAMYRRGDWKMPATMASLTVLLYAPYLTVGKGVLGFLSGYEKEEGIASGARYFLLDLAQHVPGLHGLPTAVFFLFVVAVFTGLSIWAWRTCCRADSPRDAFLRPAFAFGAALMLLFSPHYPWYVAWLCPFLVLIPSLPAMTYLGGLFYLCYTALAVGYGPQQYKLNEILYSAIVLSVVIELALRRIPQTRGWFGRLA